MIQILKLVSKDFKTAIIYSRTEKIDTVSEQMENFRRKMETIYTAFCHV